MEQTDAYKNLPDNLNQLRKIVIENGLSYRGTKHDLKVKILKNNLNASTNSAKEKARKKFSSMIIPDLKEELKKRNLNISKYFFILTVEGNLL